jgi:hypothetical protein
MTPEEIEHQRDVIQSISSIDHLIVKAYWTAALDAVESLAADNAKLTAAVRDMSQHIERLKKQAVPSRGHEVEEFYE